ncbi:HAMP domain-containing histidine kinase [Spongiibacter taiwanensis]|uniref:sensor histidine kinase n=1 Tax=Spongiibacter taiwanensis TaxID=1748242 RepID=UPI002034D346|nr:HAMP domain-containing sensor histidine kinase [Spongiibacter taiwanensis]USA44501.1 HAMP domain-containing histidine kinase [Spongiibacter taiwanensis]
MSIGWHQQTLAQSNALWQNHGSAVAGWLVSGLAIVVLATLVWRLRREIVNLHQSTSALEAQVQRSDRALVASGEVLAARTDSLDLFVRLASHDLRSPLANIITLIGLLKHQSAGRQIDGMENSLTLMEKSAWMMTHKVDAVVSLVRAQTAPLHWQPLDFDQILQGLREKFARRLEPHRGTLSWSALPPAEGDPEMLTLALEQLLNNSLIYRRNVPPVIELCGWREGGEVVIILRDNGQGFDPKYNEDIFTMFTRRSADSEGSGVGLSICQAVISRHGGSISALGRPGEGAEFTLRWPCVAPVALPV